MSEERDPRQLGFWMTLALVMGNVIGAGIFLLPASLAPFGQNATYGWLLTIGGCLCLAWVLAQLAGRIDGGPYAYVRAVAGDSAAFAVMWSYWISIWTAVPALAIAAISYLSRIVPALGAPVVAPTVAVAAVWALTLVNMGGARAAGAVQLLTTVLKVLPLFLVIAVAAVLFGGGQPAAQSAPVPLSGGAVASAATLSVFALIGFEAATLPVGKIANAHRTVPLATIAGTALTGLVYIAAFASIFYLLPLDVVAASPAPFADAIGPALGPSAGFAVAIFAAISALGCLNGWILCSGEVPLAMARAGVFPSWFGRTTVLGTPVRAQFASSLVATLLIVSNYSRSMSGLFTFIVLVSTVATLVLYAACAASALALIARRQVRSAFLAPIAALGLLFALWAFWGAGGEATAWGVALLATGIPVYFLMRSKAGSNPAVAVNPAAPPESSA